MQSGDSEKVAEAVASALAGSFAQAGCDIEASAPAKDAVPTEYAASLLCEKEDHDEDGAAESRDEDDRSNLLGAVEAHHAARNLDEEDARGSSPNIAAVERARAANKKGRIGTRLTNMLSH
jgi:hypothetical protein